MPSGYRTGPPACAKSYAKKQSGGWERAGEKGRGGAAKRKKLRVAVWHGKQEIPVARAHVSRTGKLSGFTIPASRAWALYNERWVWAGAVAKYLLRPRASCSSSRPAPRRCRNRRRTTRQMCSGEEYIYPALSVQRQVSPRAGAPSTSSSRWP
jgi:hypothetical protein